ncbi:ATP-dependent helicase [Acidipropionibacterium jensenii]|uniref:ATP-dependent helicase n=3 Tax=Acidipropionibacterium jensenii TaxID=1749 RepID=UPI0026475715|nr:ATP-dependent helicase [Acidipropionibacterium jensenii]MDN6479680.1 ATP-dependent helicase [Acidipropionibacterium jensenii]MDN6760484.1 ATP-dependent helicase [Acidipropionibacterium jensenii]
MIEGMGAFRAPVRRWFTDVFAAPTPVQTQTWKAVARGQHALVVAPTGSGKTLAAFLWALDRLTDPTDPTGEDDTAPKGAGRSGPGRQDRAPGVRVLYISPLKALGSDIEKNLRAPLAGIRNTAERLGEICAPVRVAVRTGDTSAAERARIVRHPPDILITTPETLYLMLTSRARRVLAGVRTVIVDEVHAVAGSKRGSHLALSLERLDALVGRDVQRIGLSATVRPLDEVASFLAGDRPVTVVAPAAHKRWDVHVRVPVDDMAALPETPSSDQDLLTDPLLSGGGTDTLTTDVSDSALPTQASLWPWIEREVYAEVRAGRSTLVFVNARRTAERLTSRLNELWAAEHDPDSLVAPGRRMPADIMAPSDEVGRAPAVIARAHHGSVSRLERQRTEENLRSGELRCVVATSSLELGIDMGLVDRVIQIQSPPSVSSALQRIGRAGHAVGAVSRGSVYPRTRLDLVHAAVTTGRMLEGRIEALHIPRNPLDVLAQQTVAAAVSRPDGLVVEDWYDTVRRSRPFAQLPAEALDRVIAMLTGGYASADLADLRARLVLSDGVLTARPGALRLASTSGGTIPDRGMFGVFLVGEGEGRRVGELDEEMVYESRVGDVFTLGASSWRIAEITRDQVRVTPAPGHTGRLPFWHGEGEGRPAELGRAIGAFTRAVHEDPDRVAEMGYLDERARSNIVALLDAQAEATGVLPDDRHIVLERFHDELGDWRLVVHSPWGQPVNAAWALAIGQRLTERLGVDTQPVAGDDGMVLRLPDTDSPPGAELVVFEPEEIADIVTAHIGDTALFAGRFRECASRALLLPRHDPGRRAPLWQQRLRAGQLLEAVRDQSDFPIVVETARECLADVYDLAALKALMTDLSAHRVQVAEVTTSAPSPLASSLLFNYTGAFMYSDDTPLAERRAAALSLDPSLLAQLMGTLDLRDLLDPEVIEEVVAELQHTRPDRRARDDEGLVDLVARLGPVPMADLAERCSADLSADLPGAVERLGERVAVVRIAGRPQLASGQDLGLLRDGLGIPVPAGHPVTGVTGRDPLTQLISRWARCHGPFTVDRLAGCLGVGAATAEGVVDRLVGQGELVRGRFVAGDRAQYCHSRVLSRIRGRALARARQEIERVSASALARFTLDWHGVAPIGARPSLRGADGVLEVIETMAGVALPASAWESAVLPVRVADYSPAMLDELTSAGDVLVVPTPTAGAADPLIRLVAVADLGLCSPQSLPEADAGAGRELIEAIGEGSVMLAPLAADLGLAGARLQEQVWRLVSQGLIAPDGFGPVRAHLAGGSVAHRPRRTSTRSRARMARYSLRSASSVPGQAADLAGRWHRCRPGTGTPAQRATGQVELMLERYGILVRTAVADEGVEGGFAAVYQVLRSAEEAGKVIRGYLVDGLGGAQFAAPPVVDRLRQFADGPDTAGWPSGIAEPSAAVLAAVDPANPYGAALEWPDQEGASPSRAAGALVVIADGVLLAHLSRGGRRLSLFTDGLPEGVDAGRAATMVTSALRGWLGISGGRPVTVEKVNGQPVHGLELAGAMRAAGAGVTPRGLRLEAEPPTGRRDATARRA